MAVDPSTAPSSRLSLHHLLRDPGTTLTLAPAYQDRPSPLDPSRSSPGISIGAGVGSSSSSPLAKTSRGRDFLGYTDDDKISSDIRSTSSNRRHSQKKEVKAQVSSETGTARAKRPRKSAPTSGTTRPPNGSGKMPSKQSIDNSWGFPPPDPTFQGFNSSGESSMAAARRGVSPGGMSSFSGSGFGAHGDMGMSMGKRRRESEMDWGSVEPEEETGPRPLAITCAPCRSRKIKCDSKKPFCANCSKNPAECYYPVKLKPGLRPGTGTDMVKRLENLEERIQSYEIRLSDQETRLTAVQYNNNNLNRQSISTASPITITKPQLPSTHNYLSNTTPAGTGAFDFTLPSGPISSFTGTGTSTSMGGVGTGAVGGGGGTGPSPVGIDFSSFGPSASPSGLSTHSFRDPQVLPPDEIVRDLIGLFFTYIHPWAPIISPSTCLPSFTAPWNIVVHAMVVVSLRYSNDPRLITSKASYRQSAKTHVLAHAIESTSISSVQALAILALDLIGSEQGPSSWGILALLTRSAVHLGLAAEEDPTGLTSSLGINRAPAPSLSRTSIIPPPANWAEDEARRRLFWLIFCLDRYACVSTGWDFAIPDFEVKRRLPCADEIWGGNDWFFTPTFRPILHRPLTPDPSTLSPLSYLVEALDHLGRAHTLQAEVIEPGDNKAIQHRRGKTAELTEAARGWFEGAGMVRDGRQDGLSLMIQAIHHATLLKLNAYYAYPALSTGDPVEPHTSTCLNAAHSVVSLIDTARSIGWMTASTPFFIWGCWVAARVLFVHAFLAHRVGPDEQFDTIVGCLREQQGYWGLASQYVKLLGRAKRKWLAAISDPPNPSLPDAIHVLLDLRRTAYSAVTTTTTQETPQVSPPEVDLSHLPAWAVQPLLGDLHNWFDLPAGLFQGDL